MESSLVTSSRRESCAKGRAGTASREALSTVWRSGASRRGLRCSISRPTGEYRRMLARCYRRLTTYSPQGARGRSFSHTTPHCICCLDARTHHQPEASPWRGPARWLGENAVGALASCHGSTGTVDVPQDRHHRTRPEGGREVCNRMDTSTNCRARRVKLGLRSVMYCGLTLAPANAPVASGLQFAALGGASLSVFVVT